MVHSTEYARLISIQKHVVTDMKLEHYHSPFIIEFHSLTLSWYDFLDPGDQTCVYRDIWPWIA